MESTIHWIDHYSLDDSIDCDSTHPMGRDLSAGEHQATFEQLGPVSVKVVSSTKSRRYSDVAAFFVDFPGYLGKCLSTVMQVEWAEVFVEEYYS